MVEEEMEKTMGEGTGIYSCLEEVQFPDVNTDYFHRCFTTGSLNSFASFITVTFASSFPPTQPVSA